MPNPIMLESSFLSFVPSSSCTIAYEPEEPVGELVDRQALEDEIRAELEVQFAQILEEEVANRIQQERKHFEEALAKSMAGFDQVITSLRKDIQDNVVDLSIRLSEVIVRHELPDREMMHNLIVKTLEPISDLQGAMVRISSSDWALYGNEISTGDHLGVGSTVKFAEDPNLVSGDVIVESRNGIFDARLGERLKLLKESLHERSGRKTPESTEL